MTVSWAQSLVFLRGACRARRASVPLLLLILAALLHPAAAIGGRFVPEQICVTLQPGEAIDGFNDRWGTTTISALPADDFYLVAAPGVGDLESLAEQMRSDAAVDVVEPNYYLEKPECVRQMVIAAVGGTWGDYQDQTLTDRIGLDEAHATGTGAGTVVAVLDTGIDPAHDAFQGRLAPNGFDFIDLDADPAEEANGNDDDGDGLIDEGYGHGSMVAGIVALVAPDAQVLPLRVLDDEGRGDLFAICRGLLHALAHGADVINMSFGTPVPIETITRQLELTSYLDAVVVAGAGNEDREEPPYYPASDNHTLMITALDSLDIKASFADYHELVVVSAPGVGVRSAYPGGEWGIGSGCSFAAPFVAGEAALILATEVGFDRDAVAARIATAVVPVDGISENEPYRDKLGTGRIFLPAAVDPAALGDRDDQEMTRPIRLWPNPARDAIHVRMTAMQPQRFPMQVEIIGPGGRKLGGASLAAGALLTWPLSRSSGALLPAGTYYARLHCGDQVQSIPFVVVR